MSKIEVEDLTISMTHAPIDPYTIAQHPYANPRPAPSIAVDPLNEIAPDATEEFVDGDDVDDAGGDVGDDNDGDSETK